MIQKAVVALALLAPAALASDKPGSPAVSQTGTGLSLTGAPSPSPARLDFGAAHDGDAKRLTVKIVVPAAGDVAGTIADPDYRIAEMRMGPGTAPPAPGRGMPAPAPDFVPANRAAAAPFKLRAAAGATAEFDVVYAPKTGGNPVRDGALSITGPGPMIPWLSRVALHGTYVPPALVNLAPEVKIIEPASTGDLALTIDGVADEDILGRLTLVEQPGNVAIRDTTVNVPRGKRVTTKVTITLHANWHDASYYREGIFPRTQQSTVYFKGMYPTRFRTAYAGGAQYTDLVDNMKLVDFTCKAVPASTHF